LADNPQSNIVVVTRPYDDPVPPGTPPLDLVTINLSYHDIANLPIDRLAMDRRLFAALKPGGHLVVIDHAAAPGTGITTTSTLHRIDETQVRRDFEQAGFRLEQSSDYLRNPADDRSRKTAEIEHTTDRFAQRFVKP
ncbi:MAG: class I SAM-dependent methyltransferase, partial [Herminiimonas sp.]|nr:class I SAM-dependent methyltransferase [Herminiimonas sp.]